MSEYWQNIGLISLSALASGAYFHCPQQRNPGRHRPALWFHHSLSHLGLQDTSKKTKQKNISITSRLERSLWSGAHISLSWMESKTVSSPKPSSCVASGKPCPPQEQDALFSLCSLTPLKHSFLAVSCGKYESMDFLLLIDIVHVVVALSVCALSIKWNLVPFFMWIH